MLINLKPIFFVLILVAFAFRSLGYEQDIEAAESSKEQRMLSYPLDIAAGAKYKVDAIYQLSSSGFDTEFTSSAVLTLEKKMDDGRFVWRSNQGEVTVTTIAFKIDGFTEGQSNAFDTLMKEFIVSSASIELHFYSDSSGYPRNIIDYDAFSEAVEQLMIKVRSSETITTLFKENFEDPDAVLLSTLDAVFESLLNPDRNVFLATVLKDYRDAFRFAGFELFADYESVINYTNYVEGFDNFFELERAFTVLNPDATNEPMKLSFNESYTDEQFSKIQTSFVDYLTNMKPQITDDQFSAALEKLERVNLSRTGALHFDRTTGMPVFMTISEENNYFDDERKAMTSLTFTPMQ